MITKTHIQGERICALFPCIGGDSETNASVVDVTVVTIDERGGAFSVWRINGTKEQLVDYYGSLPKALLAARKSQGWG